MKHKYAVIITVLFALFIILLMTIIEVVVIDEPITNEVVMTDHVKMPEPMELEPEPQLKELGTFTLTAYCSCEKCCGEYALNRPVNDNGEPIVYTSTHAVAEQGKTIAVDPNVIPYGSEVLIEFSNGTTHTYIAEDCGSAIQDKRIDIYYNNHTQALKFGLQQGKVYIVTEIQ